MPMPTELSLLARAALADIDPEGTGHLTALCQVMTRSPDAPARLLRMAESEGLAGQLARNLIRSDLLDALPPAARELEETYRRIARDNLGRSAALGEFLTDLAAGGIPVVVLKGMALLADTYDDPGLRDMSDIDLWIRPGDREAAAARLRHLGYRRVEYYPGTWRRRNVTIDLHTDLLGADRIRTRRFLLNRTSEELFAATRPVTIHGVPARLLEPADRVFFLVLHAFKHNLEKTVWLIDLHRLTRDWTAREWDRVLDRAADEGQERAVAGVLGLRELILPGALIPEVVRRLAHIRPLPFSRRLFTHRARGVPLPDWTALFWYLPPPGRLRRVRFIIETLFPRPAILRQIFPARSDRPVWLLYLLRVIQVTGWILTALPGQIVTTPKPGVRDRRKHRV